jgi:hypothetical protein
VARQEREEMEDMEIEGGNGKKCEQEEKEGGTGDGEEKRGIKNKVKDRGDNR